jgi:hypothetical protein
MHTWGKSEGAGGIRLGFILSVTGYAIPIALVLLALRPPDEGQLPRGVSPSSAQSFQSKINQLEQISAQGGPADDIHLTADEISSALAQSDPNGAAEISLVTLRDDLITGQFVAKVAHQQVYVTVSGHLGTKDGYVTFEPTSFKLGDLTIPVALVHSALERRMEAEREQLKLPGFVGDLRIQNGELVIRPK